MGLGLRRLLGGRINVAIGTVVVLLASPVFAPQLLAFPYRAESAIGPVRSERAIDAAALARVGDETRRLLSRSPISRPNDVRPIYLTQGGWRWRWLALSSAGSFAVTRLLTKAIVVNRSDLAADRVWNGRAVGGERHLGTVLAHEVTHGDIRHRYGLLRSARYPQWLVEGYAEHVAGESSLSADDVRRLEAAGTAHPALAYYHGRLRVDEQAEREWRRRGRAVRRPLTPGNRPV